MGMARWPRRKGKESQLANLAGARRDNVGDRLHPYWGRGDRRRGRQGGCSRNPAPTVPIPPTRAETRGRDRGDRGGRRSCVQSTGSSGQGPCLRGRPQPPGLGLETCFQPPSVLGRSGPSVGDRGRGYRRVRRCPRLGQIHPGREAGRVALRLAYLDLRRDLDATVRRPSETSLGPRRAPRSALRTLIWVRALLCQAETRWLTHLRSALLSLPPAMPPDVWEEARRLALGDTRGAIVRLPPLRRSPRAAAMPSRPNRGPPRWTPEEGPWSCCRRPTRRRRQSATPPPPPMAVNPRLVGPRR